MMDGQNLTFDRYEVFELKNGDCYIKVGNQYFFKKNYYASKKYELATVSKVSWKRFDYLCIFLVGISVILLGILLWKSSTFFENTVRSSSSVFLAIGFLIFNVILHEFGHAVFLKIWHRKIGKIRLSFRYVFPMITVDTSDSYLLPKFRRCCVSYAGAMMNIYICFLVYIFFNKFTFIIPQVLTMIIFCLIPIGGIRNDGYHILFSTIFSMNSTRKKKNIIDYIGMIVIYSIVLYSLYSKLFS
jgi:putative peptide zinc metalloprotease protein